MIFGKLILHANKNQLETSNDFYELEGIKVVSVRHPFLSAGLIIGGLLAGFSTSFWDLLYDGERGAVVIIISLMAVIALSIGRLQLISRELLQSPLSEAVYGTYRHLRREGAKIAAAAHVARASERKAREDLR